MDRQGTTANVNLQLALCLRTPYDSSGTLKSLQRRPIWFWSAVLRTCAWKPKQCSPFQSLGENDKILSEAVAWSTVLVTWQLGLFTRKHMTSHRLNPLPLPFSAKPLPLPKCTRIPDQRFLHGRLECSKSFFFWIVACACQTRTS